VGWASSPSEFEVFFAVWEDGKENYEANFETFVIFALSLPSQANKQT
jgi:hypothetical protein